MKNPARLKRALNEMHGDIKEALEEKGLMKGYQARPPYQKNDYLGWIAKAKQESTRAKRLRQMLSELMEDGLVTQGLIIFCRSI